MLRFPLFISLLVLVACGTDGKSSADPISLDDAQATCDPDQSAFDDLFYFEAWTSGPVDAVSVDLKKGGDTLVGLDMEEQDDGYWYVEIWADNVPSDCDEFGQLRSDFTATSADGQEATAEEY